MITLVLLIGFIWLAMTDHHGLTTVTLAPSSRSPAAVRAIDGDSFTMPVAGEPVEVRLQGIDAPEIQQSCTTASAAAWRCGTEARSALASLLAAPGLECRVEGEDRFGRSLGRCRTSTTPDIGAAMVARGLAIANDRDMIPGYADEEAAARRARIGLWQGEFIDPAVWREAHPR